MKKKMKDISIELKKLELKSEDMLLVRIMDDVDQSGAEAIAEAVSEAINQESNECGMLIIGPKMDIDKLDEDYMAQFGWYRQKSDISSSLVDLFE